MAAVLAAGVGAIAAAGGVQRPRRQPVVPAEAGHPLRLHRGQGRQSVTRRVTVTHRTKTIGGAPMRRRRGSALPRRPARERTVDWYTQDAAATSGTSVSRRPSSTARGRVTSTEGTWQAGVDGASPASTCPPTRASARPAGRSSTRAMRRITSRCSPLRHGRSSTGEERPPRPGDDAARAGMSITSSTSAASAPSSSRPSEEATSATSSCL